MTPLEADIAWHRQKADETLAVIERVEADPDSPSRSAELRVLTEAFGRYIMTADMLEALKTPLVRLPDPETGPA